MMVSSFQFSNPSLINLSFSINEDFSMKDNERTDIDVMTEISIKDGLEKDSSMVLLKLEIIKTKCSCFVIILLKANNCYDNFSFTICFI